MSTRERLDRLRQMADEAERENPAEPIDELLDVQRALRRVIRQVRKYQAAGLTVQAGKLAVRVTGMCGELAGLLAGPADVDKLVTPTTVSYPDCAIRYWGEAGAVAYRAYDRIRAALYPELPAELPIVIGLTPYGACLGMTRGRWEHGPRITLPPEIFTGTVSEGARRTVRGGARQVDDVLVHEMLHAWLVVTGRDMRHDSDDWYEAVRRLSPAVLGHGLEVRRGAARKSVRVPNPAYVPGGTMPKTVVRKERAADAIAHDLVARWPQAFRPEDYDWGTPIPCPT